MGVVSRWEHGRMTPTLHAFGRLVAFFKLSDAEVLAWLQLCDSQRE